MGVNSFISLEPSGKVVRVVAETHIDGIGIIWQSR